MKDWILTIEFPDGDKAITFVSREEPTVEVSFDRQESFREPSAYISLRCVRNILVSEMEKPLDGS